MSDDDYEDEDDEEGKFQSFSTPFSLTQPPAISFTQANEFMVSSNIASIQTLDELQHFVYKTLCRDHELLLDAFPTTENVLRRANGHSCGMMFCLHGPRKIKFTAIWEKENNRVLFYGPSGNRYQQVTLEESPVNRLELN